MDVQAVWALFLSYYNQAYGVLSDNYILVWGFVLVLVAFYALDIPARIRNRSPAPQHTFGADREVELRKQQEEARKRQYEHFSAKLKEDAEKRAEDQERAAELRAQRFQETGDTTNAATRTLPSKTYGSGGGFSHMNSGGKGSRSAARRVQPRQS